MESKLALVAVDVSLNPVETVALSLLSLFGGVNTIHFQAMSIKPDIS
jgi:hypothetical protein